jgi:hypothetical protein
MVEMITQAASWYGMGMWVMLCVNVQTAASRPPLLSSTKKKETKQVVKHPSCVNLPPCQLGKGASQAPQEYTIACALRSFPLMVTLELRDLEDSRVREGHGSGHS